MGVLGVSMFKEETEVEAIAAPRETLTFAKELAIGRSRPDARPF